VSVEVPEVDHRQEREVVAVELGEQIDGRLELGDVPVIAGSVVSADEKDDRALGAQVGPCPGGDVKGRCGGRCPPRRHHAGA
jgi:hypothetical protein